MLDMHCCSILQRCATPPWRRRLTGPSEGEHPHHEHALHPCSLSIHDEPCLRRSPRGLGLSPATGTESVLIICMLCTPAHFQPMTNPAFREAPVDRAFHRPVGESTLIMSMLCTPAHLQPMTNPAFGDAPGDMACHRSVGGRASS